MVHPEEGSQHNEALNVIQGPAMNNTTTNGNTNGRNNAMTKKTKKGGQGGEGPPSDDSSDDDDNNELPSDNDGTHKRGCHTPKARSQQKSHIAESQSP
ncbi:hypothetical protein TSUD_242260 [Trifolium subterraneum]|uniref:Uncharacterized protein n=1 Tax=Trifolium subterraneum TaxID=3900 RepID=A0A2Z6PCF1_TRISU|nr:hypothetical protein TSUD_242260 [Trifolium subterraneum]